MTDATPNPATHPEATEGAILRKWTGRIRSADGPAYVRYVLETGAADYARTPGNLGFQVLLRELGDATSEVTTLSWWRTLDAVVAFAGPDFDRARYYPGDERFLLDRPAHVEHHRVAFAAPPTAATR